MKSLIKRTPATAVFCALSLALSTQAHGQTSGSTSIPPAGTPSVTPPQLATPTAPTVPPPLVNAPGFTLQGSNVTGHTQEIPGGVSSQGRVGTSPNTCPCPVTTPNTRAPAGGCSC